MLLLIVLDESLCTLYAYSVHSVKPYDGSIANYFVNAFESKSKALRILLIAHVLDENLCTLYAHSVHSVKP